MAQPLPPGASAGSGAWTEPGAYPVGPGIHRIPLPLPGDGLKAINVYAIEDGGRIAVVDAGWHRADSWEQLRAGLRVIGAEPGDVDRVLVTHIHHDHYGQAAALRRAGGGVVVLGAAEQPSLEAIRDPAIRARAMDWRRDRLVVYGAQALADEVEAFHLGATGTPEAGGTALWETPDIWAVDGQGIELRTRRLEAVHTPGHTRGHVGYVDREGGVLFAGDHVLPHITPSIGVEPFNDGLALIDFIASLARVRQLPVNRVLPAHGPEFEGLAERVDELLEHHAQRLAACVDLVRGGWRTPFAVAQELLWTRRGRRYDELDLFNRVLALHETAAHLELLAVQSTLERRERDGIAGFRLPVSPG